MATPQEYEYRTAVMPQIPGQGMADDPRFQRYVNPTQQGPQLAPQQPPPTGGGQPPVMPLTGVLQGLEQFQRQVPPPGERVPGYGPVTGRQVPPPGERVPGYPEDPGRTIPPNRTPPSGGGPMGPNPEGGEWTPTFGGPVTGVPEVDNPWAGLRGQMFMPEHAEDVARLRQLLGDNVAGLFDTPDRGQLAAGYMDLFNQQNAQNLQDQIRSVGQDAAKFGRIGSGVTTSRVGDAFVTAEQNRANAERGLALDAAGHTLNDRLGALSGAAGVQNLFSGQDAGFRQEQRGERGYADHLAQQDLQNRMQQRAMEEAILNAQHGRQATEADLYGRYGFRW